MGNATGIAKAATSSLSIFLYVAAICAIVLLAYLTTRFVAGAYSFGMKSKHIHILERASLGADKALFLLRLNDKVYLLSSDKSGIRLIDKLDSDNFAEDEAQTMSAKNSFLSFLNKKGGER